MLDWKSEKFRKMFPNLIHEIDGTRIPTVVDHFEKCRDEKEAIEIIEYFERRREISTEMANHLKNNIHKFREIFGTRKPGEYEKRGIK
jgi:hypothetical protein